jgi:trypsin
MYCNGNVSAILSFGTGCGQSSVPGVYTQIRYHEQWISEQFERNDDPQAGPTAAPNQ